MSSADIKHANRKARHERKRKKIQAKARLLATQKKVSNKRVRKMMLEGRKEHLKKRASEKSYINNLTSELLGEDEKTTT